MIEAKIFYPHNGSEIKAPFGAYGSSQGVTHLFGFLQDTKHGHFVLGRTVLEGSFWVVLFDSVPGKGSYTLNLLGWPGGLLATVPDLIVSHDFAVGIQHPLAPTDNPVCASFAAVGYANSNGAPSGTVTRVSDGKKWTGTMRSKAPNWCLTFVVDPDPNTTFNLHVDVAGAGGADSNGLKIPQVC